LVAPPSNPQSWPRQTAFSDGRFGLGLVNAAAVHVDFMPVEGGNLARLWFARNWNDARHWYYASTAGFGKPHMPVPAQNQKKVAVDATRQPRLTGRNKPRPDGQRHLTMTGAVMGCCKCINRWR